jgi:predicted SAM-dependent methyltransferase
MNLTKATQFQKLKYYAGKYGLIHAAVAGVGRSWPSIWHALGPTISRSFISNCQSKNGCDKLNLGSGSHCIDGMLNVDIDPRADAYCDVTRPLPFADTSFMQIFCEEVLEHIDKQKGIILVRECYRILLPGGVVRFTTPSLEYFASRVADGDDMGDAINAIFYDHGHRNIYSKLSMKRILEFAGFENISFSSYQDAGSALGRYDSHADRFSHLPEISMYVEATKPL